MKGRGYVIQNGNQSVSQSVREGVTKVGIELLGQLKNRSGRQKTLFPTMVDNDDDRYNDDVDDDAPNMFFSLLSVW